MIREHLFHKRAPADPMFRWRGGDVSRLEGLSDGVFAVTLTLLVVSLQVPTTFYELWLTIRDLPVFLACFAVPTTFYELWLTIRDLPVFLACFAMLMMVWRYHYLFFRRYGLEDFPTSFLNGAFLFVILFYAYPLKFLSTFLWRLILGEGLQPMFALPEGIEWGQGSFLQRSGMMYFYGFGVVGVFGLLALLLIHAYRKREELELDELERYLTLASIRSQLVTVAIAVVSLLVLALGGQPGYAGIVYFLMPLLHPPLGIVQGARAEKIHQRLLAAARSSNGDSGRESSEEQG
jgi:uncharacterized membrane protein